MTPETWRSAILVLASIGLLVSFGTWGVRRHTLPESTRNRSLVLVGVWVWIDGGAWYAMTHHFAFNPWLWLGVPVLTVFDVVWAYYFARDIRSTP